MNFNKFSFKLIDNMTLHIRSLGNWTNKLYDYFHEMSSKSKIRKKSIFQKPEDTVDEPKYNRYDIYH